MIHAYTMAIGFSTEQLAVVHKLARRFEQLNHIPVTIYTEHNLPKVELVYPIMARYLIWRVVDKSVDHIMHIDADMLALRPIPKIPDGDFVAASDCSAAIQEVGKLWPILRRAGIYFNAGFFIASRKTIFIFDRMLDTQTAATVAYPWYHDQTLLNVEIQRAANRGELRFTSLSKRWNYLVHLDKEKVEDPYMIHFAGSGDNKYKVLDALCSSI